MSFFRYFFNITGGGRETAVCCPFPHHTSGTGDVYYEQHPSAHVNIDEGVFHCKACGTGHNEASFIRAVLDCSYGDALRLIQIYDESNEEDLLSWRETALTETTHAKAQSYGISNDTIALLDLKSSPGENNVIAFPALMYDKLIDVRRYNPGQRPKVLSRKFAISGLIIPYDIWRLSDKNKTTVICAGEKDMAVARSHGINAITITGGEESLPAFLSEFKDRDIVVCYDNDDAGKNGAVKLCAYLKPHCKSIKNCVGFHEVCVNDKEDITDFFFKYGKTNRDLARYVRATPEFEIDPTIIETAYPLLDLRAASQPRYLGKMVRSNIQIVATSESAYVVPSVLIGEKYRASEDGADTMHKGQIKEWAFSEETVQDILHMIDNNFTEEEIDKHCKDILHILRKERYIRLRKMTKETVFKCYVTDMFETTNTEVVPMEYTAYSVGVKLESGKKYLVTYKLVPHPYKGQQLIMMITSAKQANDSVTNFKLTDKEKGELNAIRILDGTVAARIEECTERFKSILGYNGNNVLIQCMDFAFHTVLAFNLGQFKAVRGYLDTLIVGESRMGKSSTAEAMRTTYGLGTFTSLAGNAATIPGLIGGSNKVNGTFQTRAGIIPQNHRGLIIFEELGKCSGNIVGELTDIRSSNEVRITRVSGTLTLPAVVRMVALTNVKTSDGVIKPIASYPNGIAILTELVGTAEDIARYDIALILGDRGASSIDPFWQPRAAFSVDTYRTRIRWIWSRSTEQVDISENVGHYIVAKANELNATYDCHIKIFGTEAWKKIARLAIAIAGYLVSTDDTYEKIIVKQEHVDYAANFLKTIYDNATFKLKEYTVHERAYSTIDDDGVALLQDVYTKCPGMLLHLEHTAQTSKNTLQAATGMPNDAYNGIMNRLVAGLFVQFSKYDIIPTERFRIGMSMIDRNTHVRRTGET